MTRRWPVAPILALGLAILPDGIGAQAKPSAPPRRTSPTSPNAPRVRRPAPVTTRRPKAAATSARPATTTPGPIAPPTPPRDAALVAFDARIRRETVSPRVQLASMDAPGDSAALHLVLAWGTRDALEGRALWFAVLREALGSAVARATDGAAEVPGAQDPLLLGLDAPGRVVVTVRGPSTGWTQRVPAAVQVLQAPLPDTVWRRARVAVQQRVLARVQDVSAVGFATAAAAAEASYAASHPRHVPTRDELEAQWQSWSTDAGQRAWDAEAARRWDAMRRATRWAVGAVGRGADIAEVRRFLTSVAGAVPEPFTVPAVGATEPVTRDVTVQGPASWGFAAAVVPVPLRQDDADWLPLRIGAWIAGASPTTRRFPGGVPQANLLGGGVSFDASPTDRAAALTVWGLGRDPSNVRQVQQQLAAWLPTALTGLTDADVQRASTEWLAWRAADRQVPAQRAARLAVDLLAGRTFADWDAVLDARARTLTAADVSAAWQRRVGGVTPSAVLVRPGNSAAP